MKISGYKGNIENSNYIQFCRMFKVIDANYASYDTGHFYCPYIPLQLMKIPLQPFLK